MIVMRFILFSRNMLLLLSREIGRRTDYILEWLKAAVVIEQFHNQLVSFSARFSSITSIKDQHRWFKFTFDFIYI